MNENPTDTASTVQEVQDVPINTEIEQQVPQKTLMLYYDTIYNTWLLMPYFREQFENRYYLLQVLREEINKKWTPEQTQAYVTFLDDFTNYVQNFIFGLQIHYYEDFLYWVECIKTIYNPVGVELYQKQLDYVQKKSQGFDFRQKKGKDPNAPKQEQKKKQERPAEQKQKIIIRQGDPQINLQKLMSYDWDPKKYLSTSFLAKDNLNIVFIGHVDSGKSTLTGNIMKELKEVDEQELNKARQDSIQNKMEAWEQAAISDVIPEERADGKTRQFAKLNFSLEKKRFTLFDAPGHKNYVPNMIMGACQADIAVLIISAKEGEFESGFEKDGQTKEHAMLAKALGVIELIVTVTKMGTVAWSEKRFNQIRQQVAPYLQYSCGFHNVVFIPTQSIENVNIHKRIENSWYKGPSFLQYLDNVKLPERNPLGPLRMPIIDKFKDVGNLYVYGKIESGTIVEDQTVTILPERTQLVIREISNAKDERLPFASAGENVRIRVKGVDQDDIVRGDIICNNLNYCQESAQFKANINILQLPQQKKLLSSGYECVMHMHAISSQVEIVKVEAKFDKQTGKKVVSTFLRAGEKGICVIKAEKPLCLEKYDFMPSLGRFTLRDEGKTIGYGEITGIKPAKKLFKEQESQLIGEKKAVQIIQYEIGRIQVSNQ